MSRAVCKQPLFIACNLVLPAARKLFPRLLPTLHRADHVSLSVFRKLFPRLLPALHRAECNLSNSATAAWYRMNNERGGGMHPLGEVDPLGGRYRMNSERGGGMHQHIRVNGLEVDACFHDEDIKNIFIPLIDHWSNLYKADKAIGRDRFIVLMSAPPATGKTTLALFLSWLSRNVSNNTPFPTDNADDTDNSHNLDARSDAYHSFVPIQAVGMLRRWVAGSGMRHSFVPIQAVGMDGFHYPNAYLTTHNYVEGGHNIPLASRKGAHFTYDTDKLIAKLINARSSHPERWPTYSRITHDVVPDSLEIRDPILLVEGNYFQLAESTWQDIRALADETIFISAPEELLRTRAIERKARGLSSVEEARAWYEASDGKNIRLIYQCHESADIELTLSSEGRFRLIRGSALVRGTDARR